MLMKAWAVLGADGIPLVSRLLKAENADYRYPPQYVYTNLPINDNMKVKAWVRVRVVVFDLDKTCVQYYTYKMGQINLSLNKTIPKNVLTHFVPPKYKCCIDSDWWKEYYKLVNGVVVRQQLGDSYWRPTYDRLIDYDRLQGRSADGGYLV